VLPENWKKEIEEAVDKATCRADEANQRSSEIQNKMSSGIDAIADALNKQNQKHDREDGSKRTRETWTLWALGAAAVFTLGLDILSGCQLREMQRVYDPINRQAEATKKSADAARDAADAAKSAVELAEKNSERQLRAYVEISDIGMGFTNVPGINVKISGRLVMKNFGATPSNDVEVSARTLFREYPLGSFPLAARSTNPTVSIRLAPGEQHDVSIPMEEKGATAEEIAAWERETIAIYFHGTVKYGDIFGRTCTIYFRALRSKSDGDSSRFALEGNSIECSKE
jgi:hypothetical protein